MITALKYQFDDADDSDKSPNVWAIAKGEWQYTFLLADRDQVTLPSQGYVKMPLNPAYLL